MLWHSKIQSIWKKNEISTRARKGLPPELYATRSSLNEIILLCQWSCRKFCGMSRPFKWKSHLFILMTSDSAHFSIDHTGTGNRAEFYLRCSAIKFDAFYWIKKNLVCIIFLLACTSCGKQIVIEYRTVRTKNVFALGQYVDSVYHFFRMVAGSLIFICMWIVFISN